MTCAQIFLDATNPIFDECSRGVADLTKMVVASPSSMSGRLRTSLVPALYAYWERFFRLSFAEFFRCITISAVPFDKVSAALSSYRLRQEVLSLHSSHRDRLLRAVDNQGMDQARATLREVIAGLKDVDDVWSTTIAFSPPDEWVSTESNVRYEVVEKNCDNLGVDVERLKDLFPRSGTPLYPALKELVDLRNAIAHGESISETTSDKWDFLQRFVGELMNAVQLVLYEFLLNNGHLA